MTRVEVEGILGRPPGNYSNGSGLFLDVYGGGVLMKEGTMQEWWADEAIVQIGFDEHDTVLWKRFVESVALRRPEHPLARQLPWLKHAW
jgi:hypothetical protein